MNQNNLNTRVNEIFGPCGCVNYVTDVAFEQDVLTGALIELACTLKQGGEEVLPDISALMLGGLAVSGGGEFVPVEEVRAATTRVVGALMQRSSRRTRPPFDMRTFWQAPEDIRSMKTLILLGLRGTAATAFREQGEACRDRPLNRTLLAALTALAETSRPAHLLQLARDIGRSNFRCLDRLSRRRRAADREGARHPVVARDGGADAERLPMRDAAEAEGALLALGEERSLRALRRRTTRPSVALSWYGPASVCMLFTLLALGVRDIRLGPERPTFVPETVAGEIESYFELDGNLFA